MMIYKGIKAVYLGCQRWRISGGEYTFDIIIHEGIKELIQRMDYWRRFIDFIEEE